MSREVTHIDVIEGIIRLAEKRPGVYVRQDGVGQSCVNTEVVDGKTVGSCIVGSFLLDVLNVPATQVLATGGWRYTIKEVEQQGDFTFTERAKYLLAVAQTMQDTRAITWASIAAVIDEIGYLGARYKSGNISE